MNIFIIKLKIWVKNYNHMINKKIKYKNIDFLIKI